MKAGNKRVIVLSVILVAVAALGYMWQTNRGPFQGDGIAGPPSGHIRVDHHRASHIDLLLVNYGGVSYNLFGRQVHVYIAHYERDELILHELVGGVATVDAHEFTGTALWGVTTEEGQRRELRVRVDMNGAAGSSYFDFSRLGFDEGPLGMSGPIITDGEIEPGRRYVLQVWQTGSRFWADGDVFNPERLRESERTAILYIVFE